MIPSISFNVFEILKLEIHFYNFTVSNILQTAINLAATLNASRFVCKAEYLKRLNFGNILLSG